MSNYGWRQKDPLGNIIFDTDKRLLRVLHIERVGANDPSRNVTVPGLRADRAWWISQADLMFTRGPVGAVFDGYITVIGGIPAGTSNSSAGYIIVIGYG